MRMLILRDQKITDQQLAELQNQFTGLVKEYTGITPTYFIETEDYTNVPTELDNDGDTKPSKSYFKALTDRVYAKYGLWGIDSVVVLVHSDNWIFKGIWGTNLSNVYRTYHVHLCRFDKKNNANSLGTLYHEWMHSLDALIKTHTGFDINTLFVGESCYQDWDNTAVHGNRFKGCSTHRSYIRWKENTDALKKIEPWLKLAYNRRKEMYLEPYKKVQLQVIDWLRSFINQKTIGKK